VHRSFLFFGAWLLFGAACLILGSWLRAHYAPEWLRPDTTQHPAVLRPWMVEADCYSQMARVQRILDGHGLVQNHFQVENWPEGLVPSTTSPFDYCILLLYAPLKLFTALPLDWAGALVSPFLWVALVIFWMFFPSREFSRAGRALFLIGSTALPGFIWATACGRPRHQSLILLLMAIGLTAEYERWHMVVTPRRAWSIFAGIVWGLACWTSLFEPVAAVGILVLFNLAWRRRESLGFLVSFGGVMLVALLVEGVHIYVPPAAYQGALLNWLSTIGEVRGLPYPAFVGQLTAGLLLLPFVIWPLWSRPNANRTDRLVIILTILFTFLTLVQRRWIYYASLGELLLLVRFFQTSPRHGSRLVLLTIFLAGLAEADYRQLTDAAKAPPNQPSIQLKQIAGSINGTGGIMAPWWLSPALLYFSGQPIVTGSSHCGITGIVAGAQFYTATSWTDAESILQTRRVRWVVVSDDPAYEYPLLNISRRILGLPPLNEDDDARAASVTVAQTLVTDHFVPTWLQLRAVTPQLKLYEYVPVAER
jgi:hypothetical protein